MKHDELVKALRHCMTKDDGITICELCPYYGKGIECENVLHTDAAAAIEALQAQLPKRGEWKTTDAFPHRVYCSKCFRTYVPNDRWQIWVDNELPRNYCPNCGAKMEVQDETEIQG